MTATLTPASIARALLSCALLLFALSSIGGDGCHPWWDDYKAPGTASSACPAGQLLWVCKCKLTADWGGVCGGKSTFQCGVSSYDAQTTMADQEERAYALARGVAKADCQCIDADTAPPGWDQPGFDEQTTGDDAAPQCSDDFFMGAGGGPSTSCGQPSDPCDVNTDCCSGVCGGLNSCN